LSKWLSKSNQDLTCACSTPAGGAITLGSIPGLVSIAHFTVVIPSK
jgi:hypothetical protein